MSVVALNRELTLDCGAEAMLVDMRFLFIHNSHNGKKSNLSAIQDITRQKTHSSSSK